MENTFRDHNPNKFRLRHNFPFRRGGLWVIVNHKMPLQVIIVNTGLGENTCVILLRVAVILHFSRNCSRQLLVDQNVQYK